ncbi:MAG: hypothetical protein ACO3JL_21785 [Myxococcota bacterium]
MIEVILTCPYSLNDAMVRVENLQGVDTPCADWVIRRTVLHDGVAYGQMEFEVSDDGFSGTSS